MATFRAVRASADSFELAEGIIFDGSAGRLLWVDILQGTLHSARLQDGTIALADSIALGQSIGAVALAEDGGLLVAGSRGLVCISHDLAVSFGPDLLGGRVPGRLNDGAADPNGRFIVGSAGSGAGGGEVLLRVSANGEVETLRTGVNLSNGVAFSPDGTTIYHVDTLARTVATHSYGPGRFDHDEPWSVFLKDLHDLPDGLTVDAEGGLWVAMWRGGRVLHYDVSGEMQDVVDVNASQVSCPAFVGPSLDLLAITTAYEGLDSWRDDSGYIFLADVARKGLPASHWRGSTSKPYWI
jgi:sugar lactone lactonase YvrE